MAITSSGSFVTAQSKTAGTSFNFTTTGPVQSGSLAILFVATDPTGSATGSNIVTSITDSAISYNLNAGTGFDNIAYSIVTQSDGKIIVGGAFSSYSGSDAPGIVRLNTDGTLDTTFQNNLDIRGTVYKVTIQPRVTGSYGGSGNGVWTTGTATPTAAVVRGTAGTQRSLLAFGGSPNPAQTLVVAFNGTAWSTRTSLTNGRYWILGTGTQNTALAYAGISTVGNLGSTSTEEYNGVSWASGGNISTGRGIVNGGAGTQNAALLAGGGYAAPATTIFINTEEYNGTSWASGGNLATARAATSQVGTQNSALLTGGSNLVATLYSCVEEYNGTSWASGTNLSLVKSDFLMGAGTQNGAMVAGGSTGSITGATEFYDGTTWSTGNNILVPRAQGAGNGTQKAAIAIGGGTPTTVSCTEYYNAPPTSSISDKIVVVGDISNGIARINSDGTADTSFARNVGFVGGAGATVYTVTIQSTSSYVIGPNTYFNKLIVGGNFTSYSGSNATGSILLNASGAIDTSFSTVSGFLGGGPTASIVYSIVSQSDGKILMGGDFASYSGSDAPGLIRFNTNWTIDTTFQNNLDIRGTIYCVNIQPNITGSYYSGSGGTWATANNLNSSRCQLSGLGTQNAALAMGGWNQPPSTTVLACTEEYNGVTWSTVSPLATARRTATSGIGTQNAGLLAGGINIAACNATEEYNGSTWASGGNLTTTRYLISGTGTQNAGLAFGGNSPLLTNTEEYNGTSWASGGTMAAGAPSGVSMTGAGTQNAGLAIGAAPAGCNSEEYNGSSWSTGGNLTAGKAAASSGGTQNSAIAMGNSVASELYDGTVWKTDANIVTSRAWTGGAGSKGAASFFGGSAPVATSNATEVYVQPTLPSISDKIVVVGDITNGIARINPDGTTDSSFANNVGFQNTGSTFTVCTVVVQPTSSYTIGSNTYFNKLIVGGTFTQYSGSTYSGSVRLDASGAIDTTYNIGFGFTGSTDVRDYLIDSNDDIITIGGFTGYSSSLFSPQNRITKINPDGTLAIAKNSWTKLNEYTQGTGAGAGATIAMFYSNTTVPIPTGTAISASLSSAITAKAAGGWAFNSSVPPPSVQTGAATGSASSTNPQSMTLSGLTDREYLFVRGIAHEGPNTDTLTLTSGFSAFTGVGTTGGAGGTNMTFRGEFQIATTSSLTSAPTWSGAGVNASLYYAFYEVISVGGKTYFIFID